MFVRIKLALSYGFSLSRCHNLCFFVGHEWTWFKGLNVMFFWKTRSEVDAVGKGAEEKDFPRREYILSSPYLTYYSSH